MRALFGRSLKLRQVSAGGCNACELDVNVLNTVAWDLGRFGIQFVASPRHADGLLITGAHSENMRVALDAHEKRERPTLETIVEKIGPLRNKTADESAAAPGRERSSRRRG